MAGSLAGNIADGDVFQFQVEDYKSMLVNDRALEEVAAIAARKDILIVDREVDINLTRGF
jgi:hypothetical protein